MKRSIILIAALVAVSLFIAIITNWIVPVAAQRTEQVRLVPSDFVDASESTIEGEQLRSLSPDAVESSGEDRRKSDESLIDDIVESFGDDLKVWERESAVVLKGLQPHLGDTMVIVVPPLSKELHEVLDAQLAEAGVQQQADAKATILKRLRVGQDYRYLGFEPHASDADQDLVMMFDAPDMNAVQIDPISGAVSFSSESLSIDYLSDTKTAKRYGHLYEITEQEEVIVPSDASRVKYTLEFDDTGLLPSSEAEWEE